VAASPYAKILLPMELFALLQTLAKKKEE